MRGHRYDQLRPCLETKSSTTAAPRGGSTTVHTVMVQAGDDAAGTGEAHAISDGAPRPGGRPPEPPDDPLALWEERYRRLERPITNYLAYLGASASLAKDLWQDTALKFLRLATRVENHDHLEAEPQRWYSYARRRWFDHCRLETRRQTDLVEDVDDFVDGGLDMLTLIALRGFIDRLVEESPRAVAIMAADLDSDEEVATAYKVAPSTVRGWRYHLKLRHGLTFRDLLAR